MSATPGDPDGYSEGYEDGYIAGREEAQSPEVQQELARLREQVRLLREALASLMGHVFERYPLATSIDSAFDAAHDALAATEPKP